MNKSESELRNGWSSYPVDDWNEQRPPDALGDLPFWRSCAEQYGAPVLDVCCGNGRIAIPLAELGFEVVGVDINAAFVAAARGRVARFAAGGKPVPASFAVQDIVRLGLDRRFRLAIMPDWSFQVLLTQEDQVSFLRSLHAVLVPGGALAFNLFVPFTRQRGLVRNGPRYEWPVDPRYHDGAPRTYDPITQIETLVESNRHAIELRHTCLGELKLLFQVTGFRIVEMYGDVDRRPFTGVDSDDYTIIVKSQ